jgi:hypothetical protein
VVKDGTVWNLVAPHITPADLAELQVGPALRGMLATPTSGPARIVLLDDGTSDPEPHLYVVQGQNTWPLVPDDISDQDVADLSQLTHAGELDGDIPAEWLGVSGATPQAGTSPPQDVGRLVRPRR